MIPDQPTENKRFSGASFFAPLFFFLGLTLLYFPHFLTRLYMDLNDIYCQFYSRLSFFQNSIRHHVFPLWNPSVLCGTPDGLDAFSNYTLGHFLASFLSLPLAWNGALVLGSFLSGFLVFLSLEKQFRLSRDAALLGGFIYLTLSVNVPTENPTFFLPALFVIATQWVRTRRFFWAFLLSIVNASYYLSANPQYVIYASMFLFTYLMIFLCKGQAKRQWPLRFVEALVPFLMTLGLVSFHLLRVHLLLAESHRQQAVGGVINILFPTELLGMIVPGYTYNSLDPTLNISYDVIRQGILRKFLPFLRLRFLEAPYVGIIPLLLALMVFAREKKSLVEKFLWISIASILGYLIFNPLFFFVRFIPLLKDLPVINRIYLLYGFGISFLASFAFNSIDLCKEKTEVIGRAIRIVLFLGVALIFARLFLWGILCQWGSALTAFGSSHILPVILKQKFYLASEDFYRARIMQIILFAKCWAAPSNTFYVKPFVILLLTFLSFLAFLKNWVSRKILFLFFLGVIFLDSFFNLRPTTAYSTQSLVPLQEEASIILRDPELFRVLPLQPVIDAHNPALVDKRQLDTRNIILRPETNLLYPLQTPEGYRSLIKKRYVDFFKLLAKKDMQGWLMGEIDDVDDYFADLANIRYFITPKERFMKGYELVQDGEKYKILKNPDALYRAYIVHRAEVLNDGAAVLERLKKKEVQFRDTVLLEDPRNAPGIYETLPVLSQEPDAVAVTQYDANHVAISATLASDGFIVLSDAFDPGWRATLDGQDIPILCANYIFKAVKVPQGNHQIRFRYAPAILWKGLGIAGIVFVIGVLISILDILKTRGHPDDQSPFHK